LKTFDLEFEAKTKLNSKQIWQGWTNPDTLKKWFCPRPWRVTDCKIDLRPGGGFYTFMQGPGPDQNEIKVPNHGCYLEVIPETRLTWTNLMTEDFQPRLIESKGFAMVATIDISKVNNNGIYRAIVRHADEKGKNQHAQMGFNEGWGLALKQLEQLYNV
jgi:uncharacterized protein YndB with AHSA1/START domain